MKCDSAYVGKSLLHWEQKVKVVKQYLAQSISLCAWHCFCSGPTIKTTSDVSVSCWSNARSPRSPGTPARVSSAKWTPGVVTPAPDLLPGVVTPAPDLLPDIWSVTGSPAPPGLMPTIWNHKITSHTFVIYYTTPYRIHLKKMNVTFMINHWLTRLKFVIMPCQGIITHSQILWRKHLSSGTSLLVFYTESDSNWF